MCLEHLASESIEEYTNAKRKIAIGMKCGKSKDYFNKVLKQGCPNGRSHCRMCGPNNSGKSLKKGKGKNKRAKE